MVKDLVIDFDMTRSSEHLPNSPIRSVVKNVSICMLYRYNLHEFKEGHVSNVLIR